MGKYVGVPIAAFNVTAKLYDQGEVTFMSQPKWKKTSTKMEDDVNQNGRQPHPKWKTTSPKMEDNQNGRRPKWKTTKMEDDQNGRRPKWKTTEMEDDQNG